MTTTQKELEVDEDAEVERVFRLLAQRFGERDAALIVLFCYRNFDKLKGAVSSLNRS